MYSYAHKYLNKFAPPSESVRCHFARRIHYGDVIMGTITSQITSITIVYSTVYSGADQRKHQSFTGLCAGNSPGPVNSPHKGPVTRKMFPFDDVIMTYPFVPWNLWKAPTSYAVMDDKYTAFLACIGICLCFAAYTVVILLVFNKWTLAYCMFYDILGRIWFNKVQLTIESIKYDEKALHAKKR